MSNPARPRVVCLCGSTAQSDTFAEATRIETAAGRIVLAPGCDLNMAHPLWADEYHAAALKDSLDWLHRAKIDAADEVVFIAKADGTLGSSTTNELAYARHIGKPVRFWRPPHLLRAPAAGSWSVSCFGADDDPSRPCAPLRPCGCREAEPITAGENDACPHSPTGQHHAVDGQLCRPACGCWLAEHPQLSDAVTQDVLALHGPGTYLIDYDTFRVDDLVLAVDAVLPHPHLSAVPEGGEAI